MRIVLADEISPDNCRLWDFAHQREARQGPLPPRPRQRPGSLRRDRAPARHPARGRPARSQGSGDGAVDAPPAAPYRPLPTERGVPSEGQGRGPSAGCSTREAQAIRRALGGMGFEGVRDVRRSKVIEVELGGRRPGLGRGPAQGHVRAPAGQPRDRDLPDQPCRVSPKPRGTLVIAPRSSPSPAPTATATSRWRMEAVFGRPVLRVWHQETELPTARPDRRARRLLLRRLPALRRHGRAQRR